MTRDKWYKKKGVYARFPSVIELYHLRYKKVKIK